jgi:hypothetical protein
LGSCTTQPPQEPPEVLLQRLQVGDPVLECTLPSCRNMWNTNRTTALLLNEAHHWQELAVLVMQTGYTNDLTYYYLGRAAEGLGYPDAAKTYYQISERLAESGITCAAEGTGFCNGQAFPAAAQTRLAQLTAPPPPAPLSSQRANRTRVAQQRHPPPLKQAKPAVHRNIAPAATGPDFAAPPPIRQ